MPSILNDPVTLPCGLTLRNRLIKAAMAEHMAGPQNEPTPELLSVYSQWGNGGWGAVLTGNIHIDAQHLFHPLDTAISTPSSERATHTPTIKQWSKLAHACQQHGVPCIAQINHPGRQSPRTSGGQGQSPFGEAIGPSPIPVLLDESFAGRVLSKIVMRSVKEMSLGDIQDAIEMYVNTARLMVESGFAGVQIHAAHGYLISQFLNAKSNHRTDAYGGNAQNRARFLLEIITKVRKAVPASFCVCVKMNSAHNGPDAFHDTMTQIGLIAETHIDFLEISGGTLDDPTFITGTQHIPKPKIHTNIKSSTAAREAFYLEFAAEARSRFPNLLLILTGGLRSRTSAEAVIAAGACDIVGIGRPAIIDPAWARVVLDEDVLDEEAEMTLARVSEPFYTRFLPRMFGASVDNEFWVQQLWRLGRGEEAILPS